MPEFEQRVQDWFSLGVTVLYSFVALVVLAIPTLSLVDAVAGSPLASGVPILVLTGAGIGTVFYVREVLSLARLGEFLFTAFGAGLVWLLVVSSLVVVLNLPYQPRAPLPIAVAWALALLTAYFAVYYTDGPAFA